MYFSSCQGRNKNNCNSGSTSSDDHNINNNLCAVDIETQRIKNKVRNGGQAFAEKKIGPIANVRLAQDTKSTEEKNGADRIKK